MEKQARENEMLRDRENRNNRSFQSFRSQLKTAVSNSDLWNEIKQVDDNLKKYEVHHRNNSKQHDKTLFAIQEKTLKINRIDSKKQIKFVENVRKT